MTGREIRGIFCKFKELILLIFIILWTYRYFGLHFSPVIKKDRVSLPTSVSDLELQRISLDYLVEMSVIEKNLNSLSHDDPQLVKYVRNRYLTPPSEIGYNLQYPDASSAHSDLIRRLFKDKRNGVFIESGANDGDGRSSHTLQLEKEFGWTGVLIECNPIIVPFLKTKHRRAWVAGVCLSTSESAGKVNFSSPRNWSHSGRLGKPWNLSHLNAKAKANWTRFEVESVPLYTILQAVRLKDIDFWSLDVEGSEIGILKSFPFDKVNVKVIICEIYFFTRAERTDLNKFMRQKGFVVYERTFTIDNVYVHESFSKGYYGRTK